MWQIVSIRYDKLGDRAKGKIVFVIDGGAICKITDTGLGNKHR